MMTMKLLNKNDDILYIPTSDLDSIRKFYTNENIMRKGNKELVRNDEDNKN